MTNHAEGHRGITAIKQRHKDQPSSWTPQVPGLRMAEGERALVRFLTSGDDKLFATAYFHKDERKSQSGQTYTDFTFCPGSEGIDCERCSRGDKWTEQLGIWVWVYKVFRKEQNRRIAKDPNATKWKRVELPGGDIYFREDVNGPLFWQRGLGQGKAIFNTISAWFARYGDLRLHDYEFQRQGSGLQSTIQVLPADKKTPMTPEMQALIADLPESFEVLAGRETWPPAEVEEEPEADDLTVDSVEEEEEVEKEEPMATDPDLLEDQNPDHRGDEKPAPKPKAKAKAAVKEDEVERPSRRLSSLANGVEEIEREVEPLSDDEAETVVSESIFQD